LLFSYTVIVEYVFAYPGLGYQLYDSIVNRDQLLAETLAVLFAGAVIFSHWSADVATLFLNPKARERVALGTTGRSDA
jgi:peptide/nickel transport system permease protein